MAMFMKSPLDVKKNGGEMYDNGGIVKKTPQRRRKQCE